MRIFVFVFACALLLSGCVTIPPEKMPITDEQREFIYDYPAPGQTQHELFISARNYLALSYGNSKTVSRVEDEKDGTIIGKAIAYWNISTGSAFIPHIPCASNYDIIFVAKDGKARLQLNLVAGKAIADCGWTLPPKQDYPQIVSEFNVIAQSMGKALKKDSAVDRLKNF